MAKFDDKLSNLINSQLPEYVIEDHPKFLEFVKTYFTFMESAELKVTSVQTTDGILLENETGITNNLILDGSRLGSERTQIDLGDKLLLEESTFGKFTNGEIITGSTSNATATVLAENLNSERLFISAQDKFIIGETITGNSSNASAIVNAYRPNPVQNIQQLLNFRDPDNVISDFLTNFRDEFLQTIPENLAIGINKRNLIKNIKTLYKLKGTNKGHELFFRILFNKVSETIYPREQMLRVSDGQWDTKKVLRAIATSGDTSKLVGRTITDTTTSATAVVENVTKFFIGANEISEFILNTDTITGSFSIGEQIRGTETNDDDYFIKATITGIPGSKTIINDGNLYSITDLLTVTGGGVGANFSINDIGSGGINDIIIDSSGSNYVIGDELVFNNLGTSGKNAKGFVSVVNGGFTPEDSTSSTEEHIVLEDETTSGDTYFGNKIIQEDYIDNGSGGSTNNLGDITDIFISNIGDGYKSLPTISVSSTNGTGASILANGTEIGRILGINTIELGAEYQNSPSPPTINFRNNLILTSITGDFSINDTVTGSSSSATGTIVSFNGDRNFLKLKDVSGTFTLDETITSTSGGSATLTRLDVASASISVVSITDTDGQFLNEDGFVSQSTMRIQDSLYYQDFSYVLKVSETINQWRDTFKKTMHAAGFYFTGQVALENRLNLKIKFPVEGITSGLQDTPLFTVLNVLFSTLFGRRLGTESDGTTLRVSANTPADVDLNPDTVEHFAPNTRDVTLKRQNVNINYTSRVRRTINNVTIAQGFVYAGPRLGTINRFANTAFGTSNTAPSGVGNSGITLQTLSDVKITGTRSSLDGQGAIFLATSNEEGKKLKTNFTIPAIVAKSQLLYSNTVVRFSNGTFTLDNTNP